ncbi:membrane-bound PQQ-dependent dehydrogenase, glucose/quinate/shikimate family [Pigmentiphaga aceris]|uniref:Membrane-bound PQQ-dependent dehydrogenase, glucose/quinate/shikimate family n=1 Tax=Pigmentiphaga aceris TaxID=1940612 RepID=A0A5C0B255_9BURK|nr:membrane-bound PQQ-dependent dehydrogenase, glucose/quinate/shikimate family [Pigmentiphaga aceris]QEI07803.1 membrane-bound PQQ-dependent dehydrogenase, glucose/quinate/shikimate family [Pigmentiphaga aceris]
MTSEKQHPPSRVGGWLFALYAGLIVILGAALAFWGGKLLVAGGSPYYVAMGLALIVSGVLFIKARRAGLWLFGAASLVTILWAIWESGYNGWAYIPRLGWLAIVGGLLALFWPVVRRRFAGVGIASYFGITLGLPGVMAGLILVPLFFPNTVHLAKPELVSARPKDTFSRSTVVSPDGNVAASHDDTNWTSYAGSNLGNHFSAAAQVTPANAGKLEKVWEYHHGDVKKPGEKISYINASTPLKIGDSLYTCTPKQIIVSVDARSGKENWRFDSKVDPVYLAGGGANCRGVSYYEVPGATAGQMCAQRIIWGTTDMRLGAVDAKTGKSCEDFGVAGFVDLKGGLGNFRPGSTAITSAPTIVRGTIITGQQVIDSDVRPAPSGVVRGFDARTGAFRWAWDMERPGVKTQPAPGEFYTDSTPNSWAPLSADDELGLVYVTTGNSAGDFYGGTRRKLEEQYSSALVAIDAATGDVRWHFQTVHHDLWDYDLSPTPALVDFPSPNGPRPSVIQATKSGQIYVLDRKTGEPVLPVTEVAVPQGTAPGDYTAPTQPLSLQMPNTAGRPSKEFEVLTEANAWGLTPFDQMICRTEFVQARYDGIFTPPVVNQNSVIFPGHHGASNWGGVMVDPQRGLLIMNTQRLPYMQSLVPRAELDALGAKSFQEAPGNSKGYRVQVGQPYGATKGPWMSVFNQPCIAPPWGFISGIDLRTTEVMWSRPFGTGYDSGPMGIPTRTKFEVGTPSASGGLITGGGVTIIGAALDQFMRVFNSETGEMLFETRLPAGAQAAPMSYMSGGRQYIVMVVGGHDRIPTKRGDSIIAWALPEAK